MSYFTHICKELRLEASLMQQEVAPKIGISHGSGYPHLCPRVYMQLSQKRRYEYGKCPKIAYYKSFCRMYLLCARSEV